jgi:hypothetical protein
MLVTVLDGVAVAVTGKPDDSGGASSPRCRDISLCLPPPPRRFAPSVFCSSFSASVSPPGFSFPLFLLSVSFLLPPLFSPVFFLFVFISLSLSGSAGVGSADGGRMVVLDGGGRRPRWRERSSCWEPEKDDFFLTLDLLRSLFFFVFLLFYLASVFYSFLPSLILLPSLSLPFSLSPKFCPLGFHFFSFLSSSYSSARSSVFIGSWGEVRHTLFKCRAWVSVTFFFHNACRVWLCGYGSCEFFWASGVERESGKNDLKSSSSLHLHAQGRRRTVPFKTALFQCSVFFLRKKKM